jgi:enoyl-CoA hydratase/carnithine racemase
VILGAAVFDGVTAQDHGLVNRTLADSQLDGFIDGLADQIAGHDRAVLAEAKALIDAATLPAETDLVAAYRAFFTSAAGLTAAAGPGPKSASEETS